MMFTFRAKTALFLVFGLTLVGCVGAEIVDGDSEVGRPDTGRGDVQTDPGASDATQPDVTEDPLSDPSTDVPVDTVGDEGTTTDAVDDPVVDTGMDATPDVPIGDPECGNGVLEAGEDCDDGIGNSDSTRDACRTDCTAPSCGDSVTDSGEQCDDGNSDDQDDCANSCVFVLAGLCAPCTEDTECGRPQDRCLALPGGSSCGAACTDNTDCPDGFVCDVAPSGGSNQCQPESGVCTGCFDPDRDGYGQGDSCLGLDCDESRSDRNPGRTEVCNEFDDDCDDVIDEGSTVAEYWPDNDMDGFGSNTASSRMSCDPPTGYVGNNADCNDGDANRNPNATELCDTLDNDCDDSADEGLGSTNFYPDTDNDGYGDSAASPVTGCAQPSGFVPDNSDCNDGSNAVYPGATEVCDGLNNDCDGSTDEGLSPTSYWPDTDNDGYGDASASPTMACVAPAGYVENNSDCNDGSNVVNPDTPETCDGLDNNCNGTPDDDASCPCQQLIWADNNHSYLFCAQLSTWTTAQSTCSDNGYRLVTINDSAENDFVRFSVRNLLSGCTNTCRYADDFDCDDGGPGYDYRLCEYATDCGDCGTRGARDNVWIGFNDRSTEGSWAWDGGASSPYTNWDSGEPNDSGGEDCAEIRTATGLWNDSECGDYEVFVCEAE